MGPIEGDITLALYIIRGSDFNFTNFRLYIYGGHDIREGSKDSLWMLDLRKIKDATELEGSAAKD